VIVPAATLIFFAIYVPIVVFSAWAAFLLFTHLVLSLWRDRFVEIDKYSLGLGAFFAMFSHVWENIIYGSARWESSLRFLLTHADFVIVGKIWILLGAYFTLRGLGVLKSKSYWYLNMSFIGLWLFATVLAFFFADI